MVFQQTNADRCDRGYKREQLEADIHERLLNFGSALIAGEQCGEAVRHVSAFRARLVVTVMIDNLSSRSLSHCRPDGQGRQRRSSTRPPTLGSARIVSRKSTADRDAFQRYLLSYLEADELPNTGDPVGDRKPSGGARGMPSRRWVTYVPYDPPLEMPDEGGPNERLTGNSIPTPVKPKPSQLAVSKPAQSLF